MIFLNYNLIWTWYFLCVIVLLNQFSFIIQEHYPDSLMHYFYRYKVILHFGKKRQNCSHPFVLIGGIWQFKQYHFYFSLLCIFRGFGAAHSLASSLSMFLNWHWLDLLTEPNQVLRSFLSSSLIGLGGERMAGWGSTTQQHMTAPPAPAGKGK